MTIASGLAEAAISYEVRTFEAGALSFGIAGCQRLI